MRSVGLEFAANLRAEARKGMKLSPEGADKKDDQAQRKLQAACQSFEGFMFGELLKTMRGGEQLGRGILPVSRAERMFINQQSEALADKIAASEPLGLAGLLRSNIHSTGGGRNADRGLLQQQSSPPDAGVRPDRSDGEHANAVLGVSFPLPDREPDDVSATGVPGSSGGAGVGGSSAE